MNKFHAKKLTGKWFYWLPPWILALSLEDSTRLQYCKLSVLLTASVQEIYAVWIRVDAIYVAASINLGFNEYVEYLY